MLVAPLRVVPEGGAVSDPHAAVAAEILNSEQSLGLDADSDERQEAFIGALRTAKRRVTVEVAVADLAGRVEEGGRVLRGECAGAR